MAERPEQTPIWRELRHWRYGRLAARRLVANGIATLEAVAKKYEWELLSYTGFGETCLHAVKQALKARGLSLCMEERPSEETKKLPDDGGPVFPQTDATLRVPEGVGRPLPEGMSLRDWYRGECMKGLLAATERSALGGCDAVALVSKNEEKLRAAMTAYAMVAELATDALLAARNRDGA